MQLLPPPLENLLYKRVIKLNNIITVQMKIKNYLSFRIELHREQIEKETYL